jgi:hypothetical protein
MRARIVTDGCVDDESKLTPWRRVKVNPLLND